MQKGIVVKKLANNFWVKSTEGVFCLQARGNLKNNNIFVGDSVDFEKVIERVNKRQNLLIRPPIANLDQLIIVVSPLPEPDFMLVDKLILFCYTKGITPVICVNKSDTENYQGLYEYVKKVYSFLKVVKTNAIDDTKSLLCVLKNKISAFAGQSAVGKSALLQCLVPQQNIVSGEMSCKINRGKNTTRHSEIFEVAKNSFLIDTAGFTSLDEKLLDIPYFELSRYYPDMIKLVEKCKFSSCQHISETDCEVKRKISLEQFDKKRYIRYKLIYSVLKQLWEKTHG